MTEIPAPRPWPLADLRDPQQIDRDRSAVRAQVGRLNDARPVFTDLRERATRSGRALVEVPLQAGPVLVAGGEVLTGNGDAGLAGYRTGRQHSAVERAGLRVLTGDPLRTHEELLADVRSARKRKVPANLNMIVPLGYVIKSDAFPGITAVSRSFTPQKLDPTIRVAIIDTGRDGAGRTDGWFTGVDAIGVDQLDIVAPHLRNDYFSGHGTFTAGVVRQLSATCEIAVYRFTGGDGLGTDVDAAAAMLQAVADAGGKRLIINASFGAPAVEGEPPLAITAAVQQIAQLPNVLIVASAGNDGNGEKLYPGAFSEVKAVGALNADLSGATFSNRGPWVDCSAVGAGVVSTFVKGTLPPEPRPNIPDVTFGDDAWAVWSGTSFSAPQISGAVAELCHATPGLTPSAAYEQLTQSLPELTGFGKVVHLLPGTPV